MFYRRSIFTICNIKQHLLIIVVYNIAHVGLNLDSWNKLFRNNVFAKKSLKHAEAAVV